MRISIELVDAGLQIVSPRGQLSRPSPGLAVVDGSELVVGRDAESIARLKPRHLHSRFWQELGTSPLGRPFPGFLRTADLAHAHLKSVWDAEGAGVEEVFVAVPSIYTEEQLSLFLGIAGELALPVRGLIDAAVAAISDREVPPRCLHLDLHFHRAVLTVLERGDEIVRAAVHVEPQVGLLGLRDTWAQLIAQTFVRATRFDPLHLAASEQVLYAQLSDYLKVLMEHRSTRVRFASGGRQHVAELERSRIVDAAAASYDTLSSLVEANLGQDETIVFLSHRVADLPGLVEHLEAHLGAAVATLHPAAAGSGALAHADRIRSQGPKMPFVSSLPGIDARPPGPVTIPMRPPTDAEDRLPTHLVLDGIAHLIGDEPLTLGPTGIEGPGHNLRHHATVRRLAGQAVLEAPAEAGMIVNGKPFEGSAGLAAGDRLGLVDTDLEILVVTMAE
jgi:hypothetical protein